MTDLIPAGAVEKHIAFLGATGSGKTSAAKRGLVEPALATALADARRRADMSTKPLDRQNGGGTPTGNLPKGERACLIAAAQHPNGVTRQQLTVLTGYKRSSRDAYIQRLRERGYVDAGERIQATADGMAALDGPPRQEPPERSVR